MAMMVAGRRALHWSQIIITSNPTAAIPTIKKANAARSYSSQYLCTRMKDHSPSKKWASTNSVWITKQTLNLLLQPSHTRA
jgi:hypothetical protein